MEKGYTSVFVLYALCVFFLVCSMRVGSRMGERIHKLLCLCVLCALFFSFCVLYALCVFVCVVYAICVFLVCVLFALCFFVCVLCALCFLVCSMRFVFFLVCCMRFVFFSSCVFYARGRQDGERILMLCVFFCVSFFFAGEAGWEKGCTG